MKESGYYEEGLRKAEKMKKLSIVLLCFGIALLIISLIYEFVYKAEEGLIGVIIAILSILIGVQIGITGILVNVQFHTTSEIVETIKEAEKRITKDIKEVKDAIMRE